MPCKTLLIEENEVKEASSVSITFPVEKMRPFILEAQDLELPPLICDEYYAELIDQAENDTLTPANETLLNDYLKPALARLSLYRILLFAGISVVDSGIVRKSGLNSEPVADEDMERRRIQIRSDAKRYLNRMMAFLDDNIEDYQTFKTSDCACDDFVTVFDQNGREIKRPKADLDDPGIV